MAETIDAQAIIDARIRGEPIPAIARKFCCKIKDVEDALDYHCRATLTKHLRANTLAIELERLDKLQRTFEKQAEAGDCHSAMICLRVMERRQIMLGLAAPPRVDPQLIELQIKPAVSSTDRIKEALDRLALSAPKADDTSADSN